MNRIIRLNQIKTEIRDLLDEAGRLVRHEAESPITWERAKGYWYAQIAMALDTEHDYLGNSMVTMQDTINELGPPARMCPECEEESDADEGQDDLTCSCCTDRQVEVAEKQAGRSTTP